MNYFLGIDPGLKGAFALISNDLKESHIWKFPKEAEDGLVEIFDEILLDFKIVLACCEINSAVSRQNPKATFTQGGSYYTWRTALAFMRLPRIYVTAKNWQYPTLKMKRIEDSKTASLRNAKKVFPHAYIGTDHNIADALNIALYARSIFKHGS